MKSTNILKNGEYVVTDIPLKSESDAEAIKSQMANLLNTYGKVYVADIYDLVDIFPMFIDYRYGWFDISAFKVVSTPDGFALKLPVAIRIQ